MPYLEEFLWCSETGGDFNAIQAWPQPVKEIFFFYRNIQSQVRNSKLPPKK